MRTILILYKSCCNWYTWFVKYPRMRSCYSHDRKWCALWCNRWIHNNSKKYSHGEHEAVCEGYSSYLWKTILTTTHMRRFGKTNVNQQSKMLVMYFWFNRLHALPMKELSNSMEWIIFKKDRNMSIILEAIVYQSLWNWHAFFGTAGSNNDINVL